MVKVQVSVTPNEAKRLIALGIASLPVIRAAMEKGKMLLRGGSTVSAVAEALAGVKMGVSGRITQLGAKGTAGEIGYKRILLDCGRVVEADSEILFESTAAHMGKGDVLITGANALDVHRKAALMAGHPLGGPAARILPAIMARGVPTIIAVGWEKLIPCSIDDAAMSAGRETTDLALGMAVGLVPLYGTVVTETDAIGILTGAKVTVIGAGGTFGGEGSTTFVIEGEREVVKKAWEIVGSVKGSGISCTYDSVAECTAKCNTCTRFATVAGEHFSLHRACCYLQPGLVDKILSQ